MSCNIGDLDHPERHRLMAPNPCGVPTLRDNRRFLVLSFPPLFSQGALANWFRAELAELLVHQTSWNAAGSKARLGRPMAVVLAVGNMAGSPAAAVADPHGLILGSGEASPEASELVLRPGTLKIAAPAIAGLRHGMRTALKLLRGSGEAAAGGQPAIRIVDGPVSAYRTMTSTSF